MRRSRIHHAVAEALDSFTAAGWALPPQPRWDVTDFGLGDFERFGLTLVNLATEPEYCEKLMYARRGQITPCHAHHRKKEDIVCRRGELVLRLWPQRPGGGTASKGFAVAINGEPAAVEAGAPLRLPAGWRVTLTPGIWHEFFASSEHCILGEVSTANDDLHDNDFLDPQVGRFTAIDEDEPARVRLVGE